MQFLKMTCSMLTNSTKWLRPVQLENMKVEKSIFSPVGSNYIEKLLSFSHPAVAKQY
jgi:hypothetical protein